MVIAIHLLAALVGALVGLLIALPLWRSGARSGALALAATVASACVLLYALVGTPAALRDAPATELSDLQTGTEQLRQALAADPEQLEGWVLLARSEALLGNADAADSAWHKALALAPEQPALLVEAAQARADAHPTRYLDDQALAWLEQARRIDPSAQRALWLIGIAQRQRDDPAAAAATWQALLAQLDAGTAIAVREQIDQARQQAGLPPLAASATGQAAETDAATASVQVRVALAGSHTLAPDTVVFVQARASDGSPMPVAARRLRVADLPVTLQLTDADSPMPTRTLSQLSQVRISARIAVSGSANRSDGDVESNIVTVDLPHAGSVDLLLRP